MRKETPSGHVDAFQTLVDQLIEAHNEATKREIEVNMVLIAPDIYYSLFRNLDGSMKPLILGMEARPFRPNEFPTGTRFALIQSPNTQKDQIKRLQDENERLRKALKDVRAALDREL